MRSGTLARHPRQERRSCQPIFVIAGDTMRPISEALLVQDGNETREYRFKELTYTVLAQGKYVTATSRLRLNSWSSAPASAESSLSQVGKHIWRLKHCSFLSNLGPEVKREVDLNRTPDGQLELNGVLATTDEKTSVMRVFQPLRAAGQLSLALHSADERPSANSSLREVKVDSLLRVLGSRKTLGSQTTAAP